VNACCWEGGFLGGWVGFGGGGEGEFGKYFFGVARFK